MCDEKAGDEESKEVCDSPEPREAIKIDRKYMINALNIKGVAHDEYDSVLFLAKDKLLPQVLMYYRDLCIAEEVDDTQIEGVELLVERVEEFQKNNPEMVKFPDIAPGPEEAEVCRPNIIEEDFVDLGGKEVCDTTQGEGCEPEEPVQS